MLIALLISLISRIIMPQNVVLINKKLEGFWLITKDNSTMIEVGMLQVIKFDKCKKLARNAKVCEFSWRYIDSTAITKKKLNKSIKKNWQPDGSGTYWVEKERDKETKRSILQLENYTNLSLNVLKKELNVYLDTTVAQQARKLK